MAIWNIQDDTLGYPRGQWQYWDTNLPAAIPGIIAPYNDSYFGGGEFILLRCNASTPITVGQLCTWDNNYLATAVTNTANQGRPVAVALGPMAVNVYGWFGIAGQFPISSTASVAAGAVVGITAAGQIGANSAGKQILNAVSVAPSATAVTVTGQTVNGSTVITCNKLDGIFVGATASGTGVGASALVLQINPTTKEVLVSVASTATGSVTVTFTATNFNLVSIDRPFCQGAIT